MGREQALATLTGTTVTTPPPAAPLEGAPNASSKDVQLATGTAENKSQENVPSEPSKAGGEPVSDRFTILAKKEQRLVQTQEELKKEREAFQPIKTKAEELAARLQKFESLKKSDPVEAFKALGYDDTEIFNIMAAEGEKAQLTPEQKAAKAAQEVIDKHNKEMNERAHAERQQREAQAIAKFKGNITEHLEKNKDKFEFCHHHGAVAEDLVYKTVAQVLVDTTEVDEKGNITKPGEIITIDEAMQMVEGFYEEEDKAMSKLKKRSAGSPGLQPASAPTKEEPLKPEVNPKPKTLTNAAVKTAASTVRGKETREQKRERLMNQLRGIGKA